MKAEGKHWKMEGESIIVVSSPHLSRAPHPTAQQHHSNRSLGHGSWWLPTDATSGAEWSSELSPAPGPAAHLMVTILLAQHPPFFWLLFRQLPLLLFCFLVHPLPLGYHLNRYGNDSRCQIIPGWGCRYPWARDEVGEIKSSCLLNECEGRRGVVSVFEVDHWWVYFLEPS